MESDAEKTSGHVKDYVLRLLHEEHPWMKSAAVAQVAEKCSKAVEDAIQEQLVSNACSVEVPHSRWSAGNRS